MAQSHSNLLQKLMPSVDNILAKSKNVQLCIENPQLKRLDNVYRANAWPIDSILLTYI